MAYVTVEDHRSLGEIRPLHGVNNGPWGYGGLVDVSHRYRELAVPSVRLHDPNWPHPREVDIPQVFPVADADPDDPASYDFRRTDTYIQGIRDTGAEVVYRLGTSIEHTAVKYHVHPPTDYGQWARVCQGIVRHYARGWADGMTDAVAYWEIWNEPDISDKMWSGTFEQYLALYRATAPALKALDPAIKVGGYAAAWPHHENVPRFLAYCREHALPLDFFSWHTYTRSPDQMVARARLVRDLLDAHGFCETESHLNEWNCVDFDWRLVFQRGSEHYRREAFEKQKNEVGAAFCARTLTLLQDAPVDVANYYDGQPSALFCGLFDYYGVPQKAYYAFLAFRELLDCCERVAVTIAEDDDSLCALAAVDRERGRGALLLTSYGGRAAEHTVDLAGLVPAGGAVCRVRMLDRFRNLESIDCIEVSAEQAEIEVQLLGDAVALVTIQG